MARDEEDYEDDEDVKATHKSIAASIKINQWTGTEENGKDWFDCIGARHGRCRRDEKKAREDEKEQEKAEAINAK